MATKRKVLLMGKSGAGKTSIRCVIFANYIAEDTKTISPTIEVEHSHVRFLGNLVLNIWDCGGQGAFMKNYLSYQKETVFKCVDVFIYVFNVESAEFNNDLESYAACLDCLKEFSPEAEVFCLIHKMDLIQLSEQQALYEDRTASVLKVSNGTKCNFFATSIWDETLFKAWSDITKGLIPNIKQIETNLVKFAELLEADEIMIFERSTFLVICHCERRVHPDSQRFEKISNIIKQFRISCSKVMATFKSIEVRNSKFAAYIESFTPNTFILVVTSDPEITSGATLMNIRSGRKCFENLEKIGTKSSLLGTPKENH